MPVSDRQSTVTTAIYALLTAHKGDAALLLQDVWPQDQTKIPRTPAAAVESGIFKRTLGGIGGKGRTDNEFTVYVLVYLCKIQDVNVTEVSIETLADNIMDVLHLDVTMSGTVIHGHVTAIEPGYATRQGNLYRVARITWSGYSKTAIN